MFYIRLREYQENTTGRIPDKPLFKSSLQILHTKRFDDNIINFKKKKKKKKKENQDFG